MAKVPFAKLVLIRAWRRTCAAWTFEAKHLPIYLIGILSGPAVLWWRQGTDAMTGEAVIVASALAGPVAFFALTICWQIFMAPARLYREKAREVDESRQELQRLTTPRLECSVVIEAAIEKLMVYNSQPIPANYVKIRTAAVGLEVKNCKPSITRLRRRIDGQEATAAVLDPIALRWSTDGEQVHDVREGVARYFDVIACNGNDNVLKFGNEVRTPISLEGFFQAPGIYLFDVAIENEGPTVRLGVEVTWPGRCSGIVARRVELD